MGRRSRSANATRQPYPSHDGSARGRNDQRLHQSRWVEPRRTGSTPEGVGGIRGDDGSRDNGKKTLLIRSDHGEGFCRKARPQALTKMNPDLTTSEAILDFWFGANPDDGAMPKERAKLWWSKNKEVDDEIRRRFENHVVMAVSGELNDRLSTPRGRLALIILTDQFPRNIYRDAARAFSCDAQALTWCIEGLERGVDRDLRPIERVFFYFPLEHAESLE